MAKTDTHTFSFISIDMEYFSRNLILVYFTSADIIKYKEVFTILYQLVYAVTSILQLHSLKLSVLGDLGTMIWWREVIMLPQD